MSKKSRAQYVADRISASGPVVVFVNSVGQMELVSADSSRSEGMFTSSEAICIGVYDYDATVEEIGDDFLFMGVERRYAA